jgi:hypothetical protein
LAITKPVGVSKKFHLLDVAASTHGLHAAGVTLTHAAWVLAFDNLGYDSLPDLSKTPSPTKTVEKRASPPLSMSDKFLHFSFALLPWAFLTVLQMLPGLRPHWICRGRI